MNPDRAQLAALTGHDDPGLTRLAEHLATDPTRVAARADHRTRIRRDVLARLLAPVRAPRSEQE